MVTTTAVSTKNLDLLVSTCTCTTTLIAERYRCREHGRKEVHVGSFPKDENLPQSAQHLDFLLNLVPVETFLKIWSSEKSTDLSRPDLDPTFDLQPKRRPLKSTMVFPNMSVWITADMAACHLPGWSRVPYWRETKLVEWCTASTSNIKI